MANCTFLQFLKGFMSPKQKQGNLPQTWKPCISNPHPLKQPRRFSSLSEDSSLGFHRVGEVYSPFTLGTCGREVGTCVWRPLLKVLITGIQILGEVVPLNDFSV